MAKKENYVITEIKKIAKEMYDKIKLLKQPQLEMPIRSLSNVEYNDKEGYFKLLDKIKSRTLTAGTI